MKSICVFNQKGGVGKTTTNINLCSYLANEGFKILTIDIDPQGNSTSGLGINKKTIKKSMYDVITSNAKLSEIIEECKLINNLYIAPATVKLAGAEVEIINIENKEFILKEKIKEIKDEFDFIFIDCPPSLGVLTINALTASDTVLIPIQCEYYAIEGVADLTDTINRIKKSLNKDLKIEGVLMTMYDPRINLCNAIVKDVAMYYKNNELFSTKIPRNIKLAEAPSQGLPIMIYDGKCKGADAYKKLANEFLNKQRGNNYE